MSPLVAAVLAAVILSLAGWFVRRQLKQSSRMAVVDAASAADRKFFQMLGVRRSLGVIVLAALLLMILWSYGSGLEQRIVDLGDQRHAAAGQGPPLNDEQNELVRGYTLFWMTALGLILLLFVIGLWDLLAIRGYGTRNLRKIQDDRQAMIERQLELFREEKRQRNGFH